MPNLDFMTLYIVIFLNSLTVVVVWGSFTFRYRSHEAPRFWLVACLMALLGGIVLATQGNAGSLVPAVVGNTIIIFGFLQFWIGLRRFNGRAGGQALAVALTLAALALMVFFHDNDRARSMVYAGGQATVMSLCALHLLRMKPLGIGGAVAGAGFALALLGQLTVVAGNVGVMTGILPFPIFYTVASYALLCTIFTASVWNLGFAILLIEKLQGELGRLSETDELTGLANRRALTRRLSQEHQQGVQSGLAYAVMMIDLNDFKLLNDSYGHATGDRALVEVAKILTGSVRRSDVVARMGGDEFCIVLPATTRDEALRVANGIRQRFQTNLLAVDSKDIRMSASIGVAQWLPDSGQTAEAVIAAADRQLYKEKAQPRVVASEALRRLQLIASGTTGT